MYFNQEKIAVKSNSLLIVTYGERMQIKICEKPTIKNVVSIIIAATIKSHGKNLF